jgi:predicted CXXCH cytochrome family protein
LYSSNTLDATINSPSDFGSKLCLSCHDGTVAIDSYGGVTGTDFMTGPSMLGTDLSNDHPVSFTYNTTLANTDGGLKDPATANSGLGGTIQEDLLVSDMLECNSCHNIHSSVPKLLVVSNAGSSLCLTCHAK